MTDRLSQARTAHQKEADRYQAAKASGNTQRIALASVRVREALHKLMSLELHMEKRNG